MKIVRIVLLIALVSIVFSYASANNVVDSGITEPSKSIDLVDTYGAGATLYYGDGFSADINFYFNWEGTPVQLVDLPPGIENAIKYEMTISQDVAGGIKFGCEFIEPVIPFVNITEVGWFIKTDHPIEEIDPDNVILFGGYFISFRDISKDYPVEITVIGNIARVAVKNIPQNTFVVLDPLISADDFSAPAWGLHGRGKRAFFNIQDDDWLGVASSAELKLYSSRDNGASWGIEYATGFNSSGQDLAVDTDSNYVVILGNVESTDNCLWIGDYDNDLTQAINWDENFSLRKVFGDIAPSSWVVPKMCDGDFNSTGTYHVVCTAFDNTAGLLHGYCKPSDVNCAVGGNWIVDVNIPISTCTNAQADIGVYFTADNNLWVGFTSYAGASPNDVCAIKYNVTTGTWMTDVNISTFGDDGTAMRLESLDSNGDNDQLVVGYASSSDTKSRYRYFDGINVSVVHDVNLLAGGTSIAVDRNGTVFAGGKDTTAGAVPTKIFYPSGDVVTEWAPGAYRQFAFSPISQHQDMVGLAYLSNLNQLYFTSYSATKLTGKNPLMNTNPDVTITHLDGYVDNNSGYNLPMFFSYSNDGNISITISVSDPEADDLDLNMYYSTTEGGLDNILFSDVNLSTTYCDANITAAATLCTFDWNANPWDIADNNYFIDVIVDDGSLSDSNSSSSFRVSPCPRDDLNLLTSITMYGLTCNYSGDPGDDGYINIGANDVSLDFNSLMLLGGYDGTAIFGDSRTGFELKNSHIGFFDKAVYMITSSDMNMVDNNLNSNIFGWYWITSTDTNFVRNTSTLNSRGFYFSADANSNSIYDNNISDNNMYGVYFEDSGDQNVILNQIINNGVGNLEEGGIYSETSWDLNIRDNNIIDNNQNGLTLKTGGGTVVKDNNFFNDVNLSILIIEETDTKILSNFSSGAKNGFFSYGISSLVVCDNNVWNTEIAFAFGKSSSKSVTDLNVCRNDASVGIAADGLVLIGSILRANISDNNFSNTGRAGIWLSGGNDVNISNNRLNYNTGPGIRIGILSKTFFDFVTTDVNIFDMNIIGNDMGLYSEKGIGITFLNVIISGSTTADFNLDDSNVVFIDGNYNSVLFDDVNSEIERKWTVDLNIANVDNGVGIQDASVLINDEDGTLFAIDSSDENGVVWDKNTLTEYIHTSVAKHFKSVEYHGSRISGGFISKTYDIVLNELPFRSYTLLLTPTSSGANPGGGGGGGTDPPPTPYCGDLICGDNETVESCPGDCEILAECSESLIQNFIVATGGIYTSEQLDILQLEFAQQGEFLSDSELESTLLTCGAILNVITEVIGGAGGGTPFTMGDGILTVGSVAQIYPDRLGFYITRGGCQDVILMIKNVTNDRVLGVSYDSDNLGFTVTTPGTIFVQPGKTEDYLITFCSLEDDTRTEVFGVLTLNLDGVKKGIETSVGILVPFFGDLPEWLKWLGAEVLPGVPLALVLFLGTVLVIVIILVNRERNKNGVKKNGK